MKKKKKDSIWRKTFFFLLLNSQLLIFSIFSETRLKFLQQLSNKPKKIYLERMKNKINFSSFQEWLTNQMKKVQVIQTSQAKTSQTPKVFTSFFLQFSSFFPKQI